MQAKTFLKKRYRISSIKRRGRSFKTRLRRPGVYSGSDVYFSTGGLLNQEPNFNKNSSKNVKQCHQLVSFLVNLVSHL